MSDTDWNWRDIHARLADRNGLTVKSRAGRGRDSFSYIDAREVMDRLDEVVGPGAWSTSFRVLAEQGFCVECTLTIHGVSKADCGYANSPSDGHDREAMKAAYSDAFKRAAVHWGIGRFLYQDEPHPQVQQRPQQAPQQARPAPAAPKAAPEGNGMVNDFNDPLYQTWHRGYEAAKKLGLDVPLHPLPVSRGVLNAAVQELKEQVTRARGVVEPANA